jgi:PAS domain S-box-containing protein
MLTAVSNIEPVQATVVGAQPALAAHAVWLPPDLASAAQARRLVRQVLAGAGKQQWVESCESAVTEVVSNAVLHAHTASEVTITVAEDHVRVEVRDLSPVLPVQRHYSEQATTGRGMALVAALTHEHGLSDVGPGGKTVWFTVRGEPAQQSDEELLEAWADAEWDRDELIADPPAAGPVTTVCLRALPPTLWLAARHHHDALIRELVLYQAEHGGITVDIAATDRARAAVSTAVVTAVEQAQLAGTARRPLPDGHPSPLDAVPEPLDLEIDIPEELCSAFAAMQDTLDIAERLARDGKLLARPGLPEIIAVRDWACEQVTAQLAGVPPAPWPGTDQERFTTAVHDRDGEPDLTSWDITVVRGSSRGVVAADEANRIIAVSEPLAQLVGWDVDDLVGRRVVTIVPPALREAHVAGFTRHLTTGQAHALDVPLTLPVLHRDGSQITCSFLVQQAPTTNGRAVYLAWIEALDSEG